MQRIVVTEVNEYVVEVDDAQGTMAAEVARVDETSLFDAAKYVATLVVRGMQPEASARAIVVSTHHKSSRARKARAHEYSHA